MQSAIQVIYFCKLNGVQLIDPVFLLLARSQSPTVYLQYLLYNPLYFLSSFIPSQKQSQGRNPLSFISWSLFGSMLIENYKDKKIYEPT